MVIMAFPSLTFVLRHEHHGASCPLGDPRRQRTDRTVLRVHPDDDEICLEQASVPHDLVGDLAVRHRGAEPQPPRDVPREAEQSIERVLRIRHVIVWRLAVPRAVERVKEPELRAAAAGERCRPFDDAARGWREGDRTENAIESKVCDADRGRPGGGGCVYPSV